MSNRYWNTLLETVNSFILKVYISEQTGVSMQHENVFQIEIEAQCSFNKDSGGLEFLSPLSYHRGVWNVC